MAFADLDPDTSNGVEETAAQRVFLSYSRKNEEKVAALQAALETAGGFDVLRDKEDIFPAEDWRARLESLILAADAFVLCMSPKSLASEVVAWELSVAERLSKRIIPVVIEEFDTEPPPIVARLNYIEMMAAAWSGAVEKLSAAITAELGWVGEHTRIGELAQRWESDKRPRDELLRGKALGQAEEWLAAQPREAPPPSELHRGFIAASRRAMVRRQRIAVILSTLVAVMALGLSALSYWQRSLAVHARDNALALVGRINVSNGQALAGQGDGFGAFSWFVQALRRDGQNPQRAYEHRVRLGLHARSLPRLVLSMTLPLPVTDAAFSPDGRSFVTATGRSYLRQESEGAAQVWGALTGAPLTPPLSHSDTVYSARFSPDGRHILTASGDGIVRVWDARSGALTSDAIRPGNVIRLARYSPDGRTVATAGRAAQIWDAQTGAPVTGPLGEPDFSAWHVEFSADGTKLLATYGNAYLEGAAGSARIWDAHTGAPLTPPISMGGPWIYSGGFSPDGTRFVLGDGDSEAQVFDTASGKPLGLPIAHGDRVAYVAFSGDGARVITAGWDGVVRVDTLYDNQVPIALQVGGQIREAALSPDGRMLVVGSSKGVATVWDTGSGEPLSPSMRLSQADYPRGSLFEQGETPGPEFGVAFAPDGRRLVTGGWDGTVRLWDLADSATLSAEPATSATQPFAPLPAAAGATPAPVQVEREADGVLVTETASRRTVLLEVEDSPPFPQGASKEAFKYLFSRNGRWLVVANASLWSRGWLFVIDTTTFAARPVELGGQWPIERFVIGPNDKRVYLVLGSDFWVKGHTLADKDFSDVDPGHVRAWDLASGTPATPPFKGSAGVHYLQFDPPGRRLIGGREGWLRIWDARSGAVLSRPIEHKKTITQRVFSTDGRYLATASQDATARVWDARTGEPKTTPLAHRQATTGLFQRGVLAVAFNVDATWLASAGADHHIRVWHIGTGQPLGPELRVDFVPQTLTFDQDRQELAATGANGQRQVYDLSPIAGRADDLALWAEALSARRFDASEVLVMLGSRETGERFARVQNIPGLIPTPTQAQVLHWHASRTTLGTTWRGEELSARFHRGQIERIEAGGEIRFEQGSAAALQPASNRRVPADDDLKDSRAPPAADSSPKRNPTH